ncbi:MAG: tRNA 2-thiouridine(34) synthase MnmA [Patescibacteria group bacterium]
MFESLQNFLSQRKMSNYFPPIKQAHGARARVFVGVSGGVDSSVSAAELKSRGYDVVGVFIKTYYPPEIECDWREERLDAIRVCEHLKIPFMECDLEKEYKEYVFDYMIDSYRAGITPNPDIFCNKYVKFGGFLEWALKQGADYIATGHYAQHFVREEVGSGDSELQEASSLMAMGADADKDQTYFLYQLTQKQLSHTIFPIGHWKKDKVRRRAKKYGLFTATKKDSQGICFVGPVEMRKFLAKYIDEEGGDVLNEVGEVIGKHSGSFFLTIGQRSGFEIAPEYRTPDMPRMYIVAKDTKHNTITVSPSLEVYNPKIIYITNTSWINQAPQVGDKMVSRVRHRGALLQAQFEMVDGDIYSLSFSEAHSGVAEGQSLVLYQDTICLGGGIISSNQSMI